MKEEEEIKKNLQTGKEESRRRKEKKGDWKDWKKPRRKTRKVEIDLEGGEGR